MLSDSEIKQRLDRGEIFVSGTWDQGCVRPSGYDLRMAIDLILVPDPPESRGRYYPRGSRRISEVVLQPGDVAFVSTAERFCLPWDICGQVGPKFSLASKGVLTLTGLIVDPGYGLMQQDAEWVPKTDQRLHFLLANVGPGPVVLNPGQEKIATIQFSNIAPPKVKADVQSLGFDRIEEAYLGPDRSVQAGLVFFRHMSDLSEKLKAAELRIDALQHRLSGIEAGTNQVVMFGMYLICVTLLGVIFTVLLNAAQIPDLSGKISQLNALAVSAWPGVLVLAGILIGVLVLAWLSCKLAFRLFSKRHAH